MVGKRGKVKVLDARLVQQRRSVARVLQPANNNMVLVVLMFGACILASGT